MTLGQRIQKGRKEAGLSQEELAEQLGVSRQAVSRWENDNGYPEMEKIIRLSQIYQVSLDYLVGNEQEKSGEDISEKGWYVSNELAESFLAHQKSKFMKIGICFLLACVSSVFSYMHMYNNVGDVISTFIIIVAIILIISMVISDNPYKKIWTEPLVFDTEVLKRLRVTFAENKKKYKIMILGGTFVFLIGFLFLPDFYWTVPEDLQYIWYALGDAVQGIGGCFAIYTWGIWRAYRLLTILLIVCLLTGCGNKTEKMCRIEIRNENSTDVITLEQQSQADVDDFFDEDEWTECENFDEKLVSEYVIELYQEKTHTRVQPDKENTYEKVMEYTTYKDSDIVKVVISKDAIKSGGVSEEDLTFYYKGSEQFFSALNNVLK